VFDAAPSAEIEPLHSYGTTGSPVRTHPSRRHHTRCPQPPQGDRNRCCQGV